MQLFTNDWYWVDVSYKSKLDSNLEHIQNEIPKMSIIVISKEDTSSECWFLFLGHPVPLLEYWTGKGTEFQ